MVRMRAAASINGLGNQGISESVNLIKHASTGFLYPLVSYAYALSEGRLHHKAESVPTYFTMPLVNASYVPK